MESTIKLYDNDAYVTMCDAQVLACDAAVYDEKNCYAVVLNQTVFFPEEGGQSPDKGRIENATVLDVQIKKDRETCTETIIHYVDCELKVGKSVHCEIEWGHRFSNMQQHSGEHIFSGLVHRCYGFENVGFHLSNQIVTMDFNGVLSDNQVVEIEHAVNEAIVKNVPVTVTFPSKEELQNMEYRSKIELEGSVRIVTVEGYDICACCAPHVKQTGEIGMLKVMSVQNYKGGVRISMLCGFRALQAFREKAKVISDLSGILTTNQENMAENVTKLKNTVQSLKSQLYSAKQQLLDIELNALDPMLTNVVLFKQGVEGNTLRNAVNKLMEKYDGLCAVFSGDEEAGYSYVIGSKTQDCKKIASVMKEQLNARGGGSSQMIQGSVIATEKQICAILND